jgi:7,8-dihydro-6-hydroxymethylpterin-pyrophosphokinase
MQIDRASTLGRQRSTPSTPRRTLDLDLLLAEDLQMQLERLHHPSPKNASTRLRAVFPYLNSIPG